MAEAQPKSAAQKPAPLPKNWGQMTAGQKREWQAKHGAAQQPPRPLAPPKQYPPAPQPKAPPLEENAESAELNPTPGTEGEEPCPPCEDTVTITVQFPGQDVSQMTAHEFLRKLLGNLYDAFGGASENL